MISWLSGAGPFSLDSVSQSTATLDVLKACGTLEHALLVVWHHNLIEDRCDCRAGMAAAKVGNFHAPQGQLLLVLWQYIQKVMAVGCRAEMAAAKAELLPQGTQSLSVLGLGLGLG